MAGIMLTPYYASYYTSIIYNTHPMSLSTELKKRSKVSLLKKVLITNHVRYHMNVHRFFNTFNMLNSNS